MKTYTKRSRRRRSRRREEPEAISQAEAPRTGLAPAAAETVDQREHLGPLYNAGPVHELPPQSSAKSAALAGQQEEAAAPGAVAPAPYHEQLPALEGQGAPSHAVAFNRRGPLRLRGRTDATFDGGAFHTENVTAQSSRDCTGCGRRNCAHVTGTLVATYSVQTSVTLPRVSDFSGLTPCQQRRVQNAIDNILAPHEQQHVAAFQQYDGTTRRAFDLTLCRSEFDGAIQRMFEAEEQARRAAAQAASDALDPFHFDVDLDCEEPAAPEASPLVMGDRPDL